MDLDKPVTPFDFMIEGLDADGNLSRSKARISNIEDTALVAGSKDMKPKGFSLFEVGKCQISCRRVPNHESLVLSEIVTHTRSALMQLIDDSTMLSGGSSRGPIGTCPNLKVIPSADGVRIFFRIVCDGIVAYSNIAAASVGEMLLCPCRKSDTKMTRTKAAANLQIHLRLPLSCAKPWNGDGDFCARR